MGKAKKEVDARLELGLKCDSQFILSQWADYWRPRASNGLRHGDNLRGALCVIYY